MLLFENTLFSNQTNNIQFTPQYVIGIYIGLNDERVIN